MNNIKKKKKTMEPTLINYYIHIQFFPPSVFIQRRFLVLGNFYFLTNLSKFIFMPALILFFFEHAPALILTSQPNSGLLGPFPLATGGLTPKQM